MTPKVSLLWEDTLAVVAFLMFVLVTPPSVLSLEQIAASQAPAVTGNGSPTLAGTSQPATLLSFPIDYRASVCQSDYAELPACRYYTERADGR